MSWIIRKPIVVPFDFSEHSQAALKRAIEMTEELRNIHVLHVLPFLVPAEPGVVWAAIDDAERVNHAQESLQKRLAGTMYENLQLEVRIGDPGQVAVDRAAELGADLIVVGSHGRTGISHFFLGSVAERIVRLAHCPVLVEKLPVVAEAAAQPARAGQLEGAKA